MIRLMCRLGLVLLTASVFSSCAMTEWCAADGKPGTETSCVADGAFGNYAVVFRHINWNLDSRETLARVLQIDASGQLGNTLYRTFTGGTGIQDLTGTSFVAANQSAPTAMVQAGYAYLWGLWPSGRTRRVATAAVGTAMAPAESAFIINIFHDHQGVEVHRFINCADLPLVVNVAPGRVSDPNSSPSVSVPKDHYVDVRDVAGPGGELRVHIGAPIPFGIHDDEVGELKASVLAKVAAIPNP